MHLTEKEVAVLSAIKQRAEDLNLDLLTRAQVLGVQIIMSAAAGLYCKTEGYALDAVCTLMENPNEPQLREKLEDWVNGIKHVPGGYINLENLDRIVMDNILDRTDSVPGDNIKKYFDLADQSDYDRDKCYRGCGAGYIEFDPTGVHIVGAGYCNGLDVLNGFEHQSLECPAQMPHTDAHPFFWRKTQSGNIRVAVNYSCFEACLF